MLQLFTCNRDDRADIMMAVWASSISFVRPGLPLASAISFLYTTRIRSESAPLGTPSTCREDLRLWPKHGWRSRRELPCLVRILLSPDNKASPPRLLKPWRETCRASVQDCFTSAQVPAHVPSSLHLIMLKILGDKVRRGSRRSNLLVDFTGSHDFCRHLKIFSKLDGSAAAAAGLSDVV